MPILSRNRDREVQACASLLRSTEPARSGRQRRRAEPERNGPNGALPGMFATCANPGCGSGWLQPLAKPLGPGL